MPGATNFTPHVTRTSWVTGIATRPNKKCVRCKTADASEWVSYQYQSGRGGKGKLTTGYRPVCSPCAEPYCEEQNAKSNKPAKTKRKREGKPEEATKPETDKTVLATEEKAIADKYGIEVKAGSLRYDETRKKKVLTLFCAMCKRPRVIATQDAFQVKTCGEEECKKAFKKANG